MTADYREQWTAERTDANGDKIISAREFLEKEWAYMLLFDENGDGQLSVAEYVRANVPATPSGRRLPITEKLIALKQEDFHRQDRNRDGQLSRFEAGKKLMLGLGSYRASVRKAGYKPAD